MNLNLEINLMISAQDAIGFIYNVANQIYVQVQTAKANREQCNRLKERIQIMVEAVKPLEKLSPAEKKNYQSGLNKFYDTLLRALELVTKFSNKKNWFVEVVKAGTYEEEFEQITKELSQEIEQLQLGLTAKQIIDDRQDRLDRQKDLDSLSKQQDEILNCNKQMLEEVQHIKSNQKDSNDIILQQMASMRGKISDLLNNNNNAGKAKSPINPKYLVSFCDLLFDKKIGEGSFGKIYVGRWLEQQVAIKTIEGELTDDQRDEFVREVKIQSRLRSPRVVSLYAACLEPERACLVMEYIENKSLREVLDTIKLNPEQQKQIAYDLACGLYYLHSKKVIHRDLKSANVLIDKDFRAKIADFGLSKMAAPDIKTAAKRSEAYSWFAPEIYKGQLPTAKSDIYSFAVILWELFTSKQPFAGKSDQEIISIIQKGGHETITSDIPEEYADLIRQCWSSDPLQRPDALTLARTIDNIMVRPPSPSAEQYYQQGIEQEREKQYEQAFKSYQRSQEKGFYKANTNLGTFFLRGTGNVTPVNKAKAFECFLIAAQQKHTRAMFNVAVMLEKGDGVKQDLSKSLYWYEETMKAYQKEQASSNDIQTVEAKINYLRNQLSTPDYKLESNQGFRMS